MTADAQELTASTVFWWADQSAGWIYLLPPLATRKVLCIDPTIELTWLLNHSCGEVTIACTSPQSAAEAGENRAELAVDRVRWIPLEDLLQRTSAGPGEMAHFDGLVIHDPQARVIHSRSPASIGRLLAALPQLLAPDAFVYLGLRRRYSLFRPHADPRAPAGSRPLLSHAPLLGRLRASGLARIRRRPFLLDGSRVVEIVMAGYRATTNGESRRERLKERLLSERGARILAPAYGYVAARPDATWSAVCDEVARVVASATGVPAARLRAVHCRLARGDKAIFAFEDRDGSGQPSIAVVSEDPRVTRGRRIEADILAQLARLPADISRRVPRHVGEYAVGRYACFVMTMLPGVTLDAATASLEPLTQQALDFLRALHLHTATPVRLDAERFQRYVGNLVADACARNRDEAAALIELRDALSAALGNRTLPVVFTHGDFKIENVMYTRADRRMTGVIDWEHASSQALPLIDPLYLLFYNRTLRGSPWMEVLAAVVDRQALDARELERVDGYLRALGVDTELFEPLAAVFLIHHIGRRVTLTLDADAHERLRRIIDGLAARLRATAQSGGGGQKLS